MNQMRYAMEYIVAIARISDDIYLNDIEGALNGRLLSSKGSKDDRVEKARKCLIGETKYAPLPALGNCIKHRKLSFNSFCVNTCVDKSLPWIHDLIVISFTTCPDFPMRSEWLRREIYFVNLWEPNPIDMKPQLYFNVSLLFVLLLSGLSCKQEVSDEKTGIELTSKEELGKLLFFEKSLSTPEGQDCSDCHKPERAFADPESGLPVSKGIAKGRYGNRNDMSVAYASFVPPLHKDTVEDIWVGGLFWDGRANSLEEQAMGPPLNPLEMANPDTLSILAKLRALEYSDRFNSVYGEGALDDPGKAFRHMADAIAAYERSWEFNRFDSKFDHFLRGEAELTEQEIRGMGLFVSEQKGNCAACHPSTASADGTPPLFTDFTYDNLGVPKNPENPYYNLSPELNPDGFDFIDLGLAITVNDPAEKGKFRVPTLRNVAITSPYMHNGIFKSLYEVVAFYNTRDLGHWPPPEVPENVNKEELGNLKLSNQEIEDIVAFLETLTDGWTGMAP